MRLSPETEAAGYRLVALEATQSTNDDALRAAEAGDPGRLWVVAREQRAGRGRHGRAWSSPPGNLYASLLLVDPCDSALAPQLGFVAGLALYEAVAAETGLAAPQLALKWPNDLLVDGAKVAGLLLEGRRIGPALAVVIGFGVNVAQAPADTPYPAIALTTRAPMVRRETLFAGLAGRFAALFDSWSSGRHLHPSEPLGSIRSLWLERAAGLGREVTLRLASGERRGVFAGLDSFGRLQLRTPAGVDLIDAGDLYFSHLNSAGAERPARERH